MRPARTDTFDHTITGLLTKRADLFNEGERIRDRLAEIRNDIGALDREWNFLEGEYAKPDQIPMCVHYTNGGPWFDDWQAVDFGDEWRAERDLYLAGA